MLGIDDVLSHEMVRNHRSKRTIEHAHVVEMRSIGYTCTRRNDDVRRAWVHIPDGPKFRL